MNKASHLTPPRSVLIRTTLLVLALSASPGCGLRVASADEWPQFRGPDGQGHSDATNLPLKWSETENVRWKTADPGQGWSSPVISAGGVWLTTANGEGTSLRAVSFDLETGTLLRDIEVFRRQDAIAKDPMNSYASPSPIIENGRLYVSFGTCGTGCLSTETGAILWKREDFLIDHMVGPGSSPALAGDKLIIPFDGKDLQFVVALDKQSGRTAWTANRSFKNGKTPVPAHSLCTPLVVKVDGVDQVIVPGAQRTFAYNLATGKELWWVTHDGWSVVPRPVYGSGLVYTTTGYGAGEPALLAIRPDGRGDVTESKVAWRATRYVPTMSSPVLANDWLFAVSEDGMAYCLEAATGAEVWRQRIGGKYSASPIAAAGRIYYFDRDGAATVIGATNKYTLLGRNKLDNGFMASAAVSGNALIVRTRKHLYRLENSSPRQQ